MAALLGQTAPGPVLSFPINGTEVRYTHFSAERRQLIFFFFPPPPLIVEQLTTGAALHSLVYVTVCTGGDRGMESALVCICVWSMCVCL